MPAPGVHKGIILWQSQWQSCEYIAVEDVRIQHVAGEVDREIRGLLRLRLWQGYQQVLLPSAVVPGPAPSWVTVLLPIYCSRRTASTILL